MSTSGASLRVIRVKGYAGNRKGYIYLDKRTGLVIHYLYEFCRKDGEPRRPVRSYAQFVTETYQGNNVSRILNAAKKSPLQVLEALIAEFNSLLGSGGLTDEKVTEYVGQAEKILGIKTVK